jgi:hypothetical protein
MPINMTNKPQLTGILILFIGCGLLAFTFINAFLFLQEPLSIIATGDLARVFGDALAPLIQACVRLMYLGIMGWIGSLLTIRGIPLVTHKPVQVAAPIAISEVKPQTIKQPQSVPASTPQPKQPLVQPQAETEPILPEEPKAILITPENQKEE